MWGVGAQVGRPSSKWKVRVAARLPCHRCWERKAAASRHSRSGTVVAMSVILGQLEIILLICNTTPCCYSCSDKQTLTFIHICIALIVTLTITARPCHQRIYSLSCARVCLPVRFSLIVHTSLLRPKKTMLNSGPVMKDSRPISSRTRLDRTGPDRHLKCKPLRLYRRVVSYAMRTYVSRDRVSCVFVVTCNPCRFPMALVQ